MKNWQRGEIATIITLGTLLVLGVSTLVSSLFLTSENKQTTSTRASAGRCRDDPEKAPSGYTWKADCNKQCNDKSQCPIGANNQEGWCYGFEGPKGTSEDWRCLRLVGNTESVPPTSTPGASTPPGAAATSAPAVPPPTAPPAAKSGEKCRYSEQKAGGVECYQGTYKKSGNELTCQYEPSVFAKLPSCAGVFTPVAAENPVPPGTGGVSPTSPPTATPRATATPIPPTPTKPYSNCDAYYGFDCTSYQAAGFFCENGWLCPIRKTETKTCDFSGTVLQVGQTACANDNKGVVTCSLSGSNGVLTFARPCDYGCSNGECKQKSENAPMAGCKGDFKNGTLNFKHGELKCINENQYAGCSNGTLSAVRTCDYGCEDEKGCKSKPAQAAQKDQVSPSDVDKAALEKKRAVEMVLTATTKMGLNYDTPIFDLRDIESAAQFTFKNTTSSKYREGGCPSCHSLPSSVEAGLRGDEYKVHAIFEPNPLYYFTNELQKEIYDAIVIVGNYSPSAQRVDNVTIADSVNSVPWGIIFPTKINLDSFLRKATFHFVKLPNEKKLNVSYGPLVIHFLKPSIYSKFAINREVYNPGAIIIEPDKIKEFTLFYNYLAGTNLPDEISFTIDYGCSTGWLNNKSKTVFVKFNSSLSNNSSSKPIDLDCN